MDINLVNVAYLGNQRAQVQAGERTFVVDERTKVDQAGAKFCPIELIAASLGACIVLTMAAVAAKKDIQVERLEAQVTTTVGESHPTWESRFDVRIDLGAGLSKRERIILFNSARLCEVHKLLSGKISFNYALNASR